MSKQKIGLAGLSGFVILLILLLISQQTCQGLNCVRIADRESYKIKQVYEDNPYIFRALYQKGNNLLRVDIHSNFSKSESDQVVQSQLAKIKGLFEDAAAPYPGEISDQIHCSDEFKPVYSSTRQNGIDISSFAAFVNDRLTFGSCTADQANYHDTMVMFYCAGQKNSIQIEILVPRQTHFENPEKTQKILDSVGCKN